MQKKVLIPTRLDDIARRTLESDGGYVVVQDDAAGLEALAAAHPDAHAMIVRSEEVTAEILDSFRRLKVIIRAGAGYNTIDVTHARACDIDVMNTPGANANAVAEEVIALMLADARHIVAADISARAGRWEKKKFMGREIMGKTIGVVGVGEVGQCVIRRLQGFDMNILGYDPVLTEERARELGVELVELADLFGQSDYVTLHVPENDQTLHMVNRELLDLMKPGATIINCARAGIIHEEDLRAVRQKKEVRFLNDVYSQDEPGPKSIADVADLMLPHLGGSTVEANGNAARRAAEQLIEFDVKGITSYIVNRDIPAGLDEAYGELAYSAARLCRHMVDPRKKLSHIKTSFYGSLAEYRDWLIIPVAAAVLEGFNRSMGHAAAHQYMKDIGIDYEDREPDESKGFQNSITIDLVAPAGADPTRRASVRGTVAEGNVMISRINDFDKLYFDPAGHNLIVTYEDRPGVLGQIASTLAKSGINIDDVRNPHDSKGVQSLALLKVNQAVPDRIVDKIAKCISADVAVYAAL
jgi:D-3-phosphoglycerate dehydrogenase